MIDTDKYEGCQTDRPLVLHKGLLCPTVFIDVDNSGVILPTLDRGIVDVQADIPEHYLQLLRDAPLLLAEVKRLREVIDKEHPTFDWASRQTIANLDAEVKRLRKREATFDAFIDSLDCHNEHEWMLIERIDEIDERLHGGEEE